MLPHVVKILHLLIHNVFLFCFFLGSLCEDGLNLSKHLCSCGNKQLHYRPCKWVEKWRKDLIVIFITHTGAVLLVILFRFT